MTEPTQLKPCPFCGSAATMVQFESAWGGRVTEIGCGSSECHMSPATDEVPVEMAIAAWNGRPTEDAAVKQRDAQIVAWLRADADTLEREDTAWNAAYLAEAIRECADAIERGEV